VSYGAMVLCGVVVVVVVVVLIFDIFHLKIFLSYISF
jgi:hypothetical protein